MSEGRGQHLHDGSDRSEATDLEGKRTVYAGCITARQVQPVFGEPPFRPIQIAAATLRRSDESLDRALPSLCNSQ